MFARTVWSDDVLAETITDLIHHFHLTSLKTLGTEGSDNAKHLNNKIKENQIAWEKRHLLGTPKHTHDHFNLSDVIL